MTMCADLRKSEFALMSAFNLATQLISHGLHTIADTQHRDAKLKNTLRCLVGTFFIYAGMAAGKDDAFQLPVAGVLFDPFVTDIAGMYFAIHVGLTDAACNQLCDLRTKIKDENFLMHGE